MRRKLGLGVEPLECRALLATITVTGTGDSIAVDGFVTLREAITSVNDGAKANADVAAIGAFGTNDTIKFNISGLPGTVHTIKPNSALPTITKPVFIDGYSQLGASSNTATAGSNAFLAIELDGSNAGFFAGLVISAGQSTVQGLIVNRFNNEGILLYSGGGNVIRGNFLGTDATGKLDRGNGIVGVATLSANNLIGGTALADRNLISGNNFGGIAVIGASATGNSIRNNLIGADDTGANPLPNTGAGIRLSSAASTTIGGVAANAGNRIAFNDGPGVRLSNPGEGNAVIGNAIFGNQGLGIDLNGDGVTGNDPLDADSGPNGLQNAPVLTSVQAAAGVVTIAGTLSSTPNTSFIVELFASDAADPSGHGEGQTLLGSIAVTTSDQGVATINYQSLVALAVGKSITATATEFLVNNTSEFSNAVAVAAGLLGDANKDGKVDLTDFGILKQQFGQTGDNLAADFNQDGKVDLTDFGILKENFGKVAAALPVDTTSPLSRESGAVARPLTARDREDTDEAFEDERLASLGIHL